MAIVFPCPCGRKLQVAEELAGKPVRCPACSEVVNAVAPPREPEPPVAQLAPEDPPPIPRAQPLAQPRPGRTGHATAAPTGRQSKLAIAGLVVSGAALYLGNLLNSLSIAVLGGLVGACISIVAWFRVRASGGKLRGAELASSGALIGLGGLATGIVLLLLGIVLIAALIYFAGEISQMFPGGTSTCR